MSSQMLLVSTTPLIHRYPFGLTMLRTHDTSIRSCCTDIEVDTDDCMDVPRLDPSTLPTIPNHDLDRLCLVFSRRHHFVPPETSSGQLISERLVEYGWKPQ